MWRSWRPELTERSSSSREGIPLKYQDKRRKILFLLDYDGTLTDFTHDPERSNLTPKKRGLLKKLIGKYPVIFITGRHAEGLRRVSRLGEISIAGTHGFEGWRLPRNIRLASPAHQRRYRKEAAALWKAIQVLPERYPGIHIERKPFSSTLHYRRLNLPPEKERSLHRDFRRLYIQAVTGRFWTFQAGKKMIEAIPRGYTKGKAVRKILEKFPDHLPIFAGDDLTDLTVFKAMGKRGLKVAVGNRIPDRFCDLRFKHPEAFLEWLRIFV